MKTEHFRAMLQEGHRGLAVEVPFDPTHRWGAPSVRLEPGRHGHRVHGRLNDTPVDSAIMALGGGFFLEVSPDTVAAAGVAAGQEVELVLHPGAAGGDKPARRSRRSRSAGPA